MNNTNKIGGRHGDLSFHPVKALPENIKSVKHDGSFILARGEHTGHKHVIVAPAKQMNIYQDAEGRYILEVKETAIITHEEHKTITLMPGIYRQEQEQERDPFLDQIKTVID